MGRLVLVPCDEYAARATYLEGDETSQALREDTQSLGVHMRWIQSI
jgi:hypothetical protein